MGRLRGWRDRLVYLWRRALEENATPSRFAWAVALGAFISAGPFYGLRSPFAIVAAWASRLNRLTALLASHLLSGPLALLAIAWEIKLGGAILDRPFTWPSSSIGLLDAIALARGALLSWVLGATIVALPFAAFCGAIAYPVARRWQERRRKRIEALAHRTEGAP